MKFLKQSRWAANLLLNNNLMRMFLSKISNRLSHKTFDSIRFIPWECWGQDLILMFSKGELWIVFVLFIFVPMRPKSGIQDTRWWYRVSYTVFDKWLWREYVKVCENIAQERATCRCDTMKILFNRQKDSIYLHVLLQIPKNI